MSRPLRLQTVQAAAAVVADLMAEAGVAAVDAVVVALTEEVCASSQPEF